MEASEWNGGVKRQNIRMHHATTTALNESKPQKRKKETLGKRIKQLIKKNMDTSNLQRKTGCR